MSKTILELLVEHEVNGATPISITTETIPVLKGGKSNPMKGLVIKRMEKANVMIFQNKRINGYEAMIERRLIAEKKDPASFVLGPRQWGVRREGMPFVDHIKIDKETKEEVSEVYLEVIFLKTGKVTYWLDGEEIDRDDVQGLDTSKEEGEQGGLDNKVIIRTFNVKNVKEISIGGDHYILDNYPF